MKPLMERLRDSKGFLLKPTPLRPVVNVSLIDGQQLDACIRRMAASLEVTRADIVSPARNSDLRVAAIGLGMEAGASCRVLGGYFRLSAQRVCQIGQQFLRNPTLAEQWRKASREERWFSS